MTSADTTRLIGGPIKRYGGKGNSARRIVPHFARATIYAEGCFGAGSIFFQLPEGTYERRVVNDLDGSVVTFFRVLRDRPDDLYAGWRTVSNNVALNGARDTKGARRTEVLWCSYPEADEIGAGSLGFSEGKSPC